MENFISDRVLAAKTIFVDFMNCLGGKICPNDLITLTLNHVYIYHVLILAFTHHFIILIYDYPL